MSIYSGLPTREDEKNYNRLLSKLITLLQSQIIDLTKGLIPVSYAGKYQRIISKMQTYEEHKYLPPKFTDLLHPLQEAISSKRAVQTETDIQKDSKLERLEEVQEQEEQGNSAREMKNYKTEAQIKMKKSVQKHKKFNCQKSLLGEEPATKQNKMRSFSLFGETQNKKARPIQDPKLQTHSFHHNQGSHEKINKKIEKMGSSHQRIKIYAPGSRRINKLKTAQQHRICREAMFNQFEDEERITGKTMDQIMGSLKKQDKNSR